VFALGIVVLALIARGPHVAVLVGGVIVLSNLTTVLLAHTVSVGRVPFPDPTSWPSNHTTAVAAAGLSLLLIARGRLLAPTAVLAFGMTAGLPLMLLVRGTHLLSDLVAAQLVVGFWALLAAQSRWLDSDPA
jgi:hypothetical protein